VLKWLILLSVLCASAAGAHTVWTWTDENGQVHYSDRPVPGARQVELRGAQAVVVAPAPTARAAPPAEREPAESRPYRSVRVVSPAEQAVLWNIGGQLNVQIATDPALRADHRVDVSIDGERRNLNVASAQLVVPEVWRGEHVLQAVIVDAQGRELQRSDPVVFYVQQTSILNPHNPNVRR
jgi:hypothetical protein